MAQIGVGANTVVQLYSATLTRDADGRITQAVIDENGVTTTWGYTYDARGRLATVSENGSVVDTYGYDGNGNRISVNGQTVATYNADDQLTSYNGVPYTYAADGSLASAGSTTYQYDALGHLLAVHQAEISTFKWPRILGQPHEQGGGEDCRPQQGYA